MPYCTECGSPVKDTDKFCTNCGNQIQPRIQNAPKKFPETGPQGRDFWRSEDFEEFKRVAAWIVDKNSTALCGITREILPYMSSHIVKEQDSIRLTDDGGPASLYGLLFYLNWLDILGRDTVNDFGIVPKDIKIPDDRLERIENEFIQLAKSYKETQQASRTINTVSSVFSDYSGHLAQLLFEEDVSDVKKVRGYERTIRKFLENLEKHNLSQLDKVDYQRYTEANKTGKNVTSTINAETSYGKFLYPYSYVIHDDLKTDPERYISPFFSLGSLEEKYKETLSMVQECKDNSGFMRKPPENLRKKTLASLTELETMVLKIAAVYHVTQISYYTSDKINRSKDQILRYIRQRSYNKAIKEIYDLIYYANLVQPVLSLISPY
ncbi:zinc-ribbon domain-containing protein [Candidatus Bathyarchaeota archaeon]|nr:zinc-ribbon domain-containing protein [Candidatus Bathyarchaeota archaeon]